MVEMKCRYFALALLGTLVAGSARAQSEGMVSAPQAVVAEVDSVEDVYELDGVVVEASGRRLTAEGASVIPNKLQKEASSDGYDLVRRLGIPQLAMRPGSESIQTVAGENVSTFINFMEASPNDVAGLDPKDVVRVDYLQFPKDPRFAGAQFVVNYIVKEPDYGGYTRLRGNGALYGGRQAGASAFSKFYTGKTAFDLFLGYNYSNSHHGGSDSDEWYRLTDSEGREYEQLRSTYTERFRTRSYSLPVSLRVRYNTDKLQIANRLSYTWQQTPSTLDQGRLHFSPGAAADYEYLNSGSGKSNSASWDGSYYIGLPRDFSFTILPRVQYSHYNSSSNYLTSVPGDAGIFTGSSEDALFSRADIYFNKTWNDRFSLGVLGIFYYKYNHIEYGGSNPYLNKMRGAGGSGSVNFKAMWSNFNANIEVGFLSENTYANGITTNKFAPRFVADLTWLITPKHKLHWFAQMAASSPGISEQSPNVIQKNEFMYITGNPEFKSYEFFESYLDYVWMINNHFTLVPMLYYKRNWSPGQWVYEPYLAGSAILRYPENSGYYQQFHSMLKLRYAPMQALAFEGTLFYVHQGLEGVNHRHSNCLQFLLQADYYFKRFSVSAFFQRYDESIDEMSGAIESNPNSYGLMLGWADKGWNVSLNLRNPFRYTWQNSRTRFDSPYYSYDNRIYTGGNHSQLTLTVSYTFRYGKQRNDYSEIGAGQGAASGILK